MNARVLATLAVTALLLATGTTAAGPKPPPRSHRDLLDIAPPDGRPSPEQGRRALAEARAEGRYGFCQKPTTPLFPRQKSLCSLAEDTPDCEGLVKACELEPPKPPPSWLLRALEALGPVAKVLVWLVVGLIVLAVLYPVVRGLLNRRRDKRLRDQKAAAPNVAAAFEPPKPDVESTTDAEAALRAADDLARGGQIERALGLYLVASLAALDRRGVIRLAKHKTNGDYVRACADANAKQPLRDIVREVDRVTFGHRTPSAEVVASVASRATALVRHTAVLTLFLLAAGCGALRGGGPNDPAGDELPIDVLGRSGFRVERLGRSIASLPLPSETPDAEPELVIVDLSRTQLEEESSAHLMRWVEDGGHLMLFGSPEAWPKSLAAKEGVFPNGRDLEVGDGQVTGAKVAQARSLDWPGAEPEARVGTYMYAAHKWVGRGFVFGVAGSDLLTNVGVARPDNAAALVTLVGAAANGHWRVKIARAEDGIPPPDNPFASLARAGLTRGLWHALAASLLLFLAFGIRHARPTPVVPDARRAFAEHVEATGALYGRTRAFSLALASYGRYAEARVREKAPRGADPVMYLATQANVPRGEVQKVWTRATSATPDAPVVGDELETIRSLRALLAKSIA